MSGCNFAAAAVVGKVLGYPNCCIDAHGARISSNRIASSELAHRAMGTAPAKCRYHWIPCEACSKRIVEGKSTFRSLLTWARPLENLENNLAHPAVQRQAESVLDAEEYALYQSLASSSPMVSAARDSHFSGQRRLRGSTLEAPAKGPKKQKQQP
mmetsp:Transcript_69952/g.167924  ORF Transcript_69952/g.167924 Transcript_69952/m.167924 type:complete len:155 (+) Transcript_69952:103-567(+)